MRPLSLHESIPLSAYGPRCALSPEQETPQSMRQGTPKHVPLDWYTRYGLRADQMRLPKEASKREALARQVGLDGYQLLEEVWAATSAPYLRTLPALEA